MGLYEQNRGLGDLHKGSILYVKKPFGTTHSKLRNRSPTSELRWHSASLHGKKSL